MRITNIIKQHENGNVIVSGDIIQGKNKKHTIYLSIDKRYESFIHLDASCFLAVILIPAMKVGEDIYIEGSTSQALLNHLEKMMDIEVSWNIGLKKINIYAETVIADPVGINNVGTFFSGGVDSFYTLLKNKQSNEKKITHFILVHGFDIPIKNQKAFEVVRKNVNEIAEKENIQVIVVTTNLREFIDKFIGWGFAFGSALGAVSLFLRTGFQTIYIPSSHDYTGLFPWGSHPDTDPLWSTEMLQVIHDGAEASRIEKTYQQIAKSDIALKYLRVCWKNVEGRYNCGMCSKCVRTMIDLRIAKVLEKSSTFDKPLTMDLIRDLDARDSSSQLFLNQSLKFLETKDKDQELQKNLRFLMQEKRYSYSKIIRGYLGKLDREYNKNRVFKFLSKYKII